MTGWLRLTFLVAIVAAVGVVPTIHYRATYAHGKRLRVVRDGKVYRSGQLTAEGFAEAVRLYNIRTIVNLQEDAVDPDLPRGFFDRRTVRESELCRELGVRYVQLSPDLLPRRLSPAQRPAVVEDLLAVLDDPTAYPVLLHCRAGLHRTGCMVGIYRMEYEGWSPEEAYQELKKNGFGDRACTSANLYVKQYVLDYRRGQRRATHPDAQHSARGD